MDQSVGTGELEPSPIPDSHHVHIGVVAESGASSPKEMGKVMSQVMPRVQGRADGKRVSALVKELLTA